MADETLEQNQNFTLHDYIGTLENYVRNRPGTASYNGRALSTNHYSIESQEFWHRNRVVQGLIQQDINKIFAPDNWRLRDFRTIWNSAVEDLGEEYSHLKVDKGDKKVLHQTNSMTGDWELAGDVLKKVNEKLENGQISLRGYATEAVYHVSIGSTMGGYVSPTPSGYKVNETKLARLREAAEGIKGLAEVIDDINTFNNTPEFSNPNKTIALKTALRDYGFATTISPDKGIGSVTPSLHLDNSVTAHTTSPMFRSYGNGFGFALMRFNRYFQDVLNEPEIRAITQLDMLPEGQFYSHESMHIGMQRLKEHYGENLGSELSRLLSRSEDLKQQLESYSESSVPSDENFSVFLSRIPEIYDLIYDENGKMRENEKGVNYEKAIQQHDQYAHDMLSMFRDMFRDGNAAVQWGVFSNDYSKVIDASVGKDFSYESFEDFLERDVSSVMDTLAEIEDETDGWTHDGAVRKAVAKHMGGHTISNKGTKFFEDEKELERFLPFVAETFEMKVEWATGWRHGTTNSVIARITHENGSRALPRDIRFSDEEFIQWVRDLKNDDPTKFQKYFNRLREPDSSTFLGMVEPDSMEEIKNLIALKKVLIGSAFEVFPETDQFDNRDLINSFGYDINGFDPNPSLNDGLFTFNFIQNLRLAQATFEYNIEYNADYKTYLLENTDLTQEELDNFEVTGNLGATTLKLLAASSNEDAVSLWQLAAQPSNNPEENTDSPKHVQDFIATTASLSENQLATINNHPIALLTERIGKAKIDTSPEIAAELKRLADAAEANIRAQSRALKVFGVRDHDIDFTEPGDEEHIKTLNMLRNEAEKFKDGGKRDLASYMQKYLETYVGPDTITGHPNDMNARVLALIDRAVDLGIISSRVRNETIASDHYNRLNEAMAVVQQNSVLSKEINRETSYLLDAEAAPHFAALVDLAIKNRTAMNQLLDEEHHIPELLPAYRDAAGKADFNIIERPDMVRVLQSLNMYMVKNRGFEALVDNRIGGWSSRMSEILADKTEATNQSALAADNLSTFLSRGGKNGSQVDSFFGSVQYYTTRIGADRLDAIQTLTLTADILRDVDADYLTYMGDNDVKTTLDLDESTPILILKGIATNAALAEIPGFPKEDLELKADAFDEIGDLTLQQLQINRDALTGWIEAELARENNFFSTIEESFETVIAPEQKFLILADQLVAFGALSPDQAQEILSNEEETLEKKRETLEKAIPEHHKNMVGILSTRIDNMLSVSPSSEQGQQLISQMSRMLSPSQQIRLQPQQVMQKYLSEGKDTDAIILLDELLNQRNASKLNVPEGIQLDQAEYGAKIEEAVYFTALQERYYQNAIQLGLTPNPELAATVTPAPVDTTPTEPGTEEDPNEPDPNATGTEEDPNEPDPNATGTGGETQTNKNPYQVVEVGALPAPVRERIMAFQRATGLEANGEMNEATQQKIFAFLKKDKIEIPSVKEPGADVIEMLRAKLEADSTIEHRRQNERFSYELGQRAVLREHGLTPEQSRELIDILNNSTDTHVARLNLTLKMKEQGVEDDRIRGIVADLWLLEHRQRNYDGDVTEIMLATEGFENLQQLSAVYDVLSFFEHGTIQNSLEAATKPTRSPSELESIDDRFFAPEVYTDLERHGEVDGALIGLESGIKYGRDAVAAQALNEFERRAQAYADRFHEGDMSNVCKAMFEGKFNPWMEDLKLVYEGFGRPSGEEILARWPKHVEGLTAEEIDKLPDWRLNSVIAAHRNEAMNAMIGSPADMGLTKTIINGQEQTVSAETLNLRLVMRFTSERDFKEEYGIDMDYNMSYEEAVQRIKDQVPADDQAAILAELTKDMETFSIERQSAFSFFRLGDHDLTPDNGVNFTADYEQLRRQSLLDPSLNLGTSADLATDIENEFVENADDALKAAAGDSKDPSAVTPPTNNTTPVTPPGG